ncbi:unnamed protein product, partial [Laminaria digitata]
SKCYPSFGPEVVRGSENLHPLLVALSSLRVVIVSYSMACQISASPWQFNHECQRKNGANTRHKSKVSASSITTAEENRCKIKTSTIKRGGHARWRYLLSSVAFSSLWNHWAMG